MKKKYSETGMIEKEVKKQPPCILFRDFDGVSEEEKKSMNKHFVVTSSRMLVHGGELVIGRYSVLPFYRELEVDLAHRGAKLINTFANHRYVADLQNYVEDLGELTPCAWKFGIDEIPDNIPCIVKGETNSKKENWNTMMFARNKREVTDIAIQLMNDSLISSQTIYVRPFLPLKTFCYGLNGQPITMEFRFFVCRGQVISGGYYWSSFLEQLPSTPSPSMVPVDFLKKAIDKVKDKIPFFALDVAQLDNGEWIVIELNDGQMSGLSENNPEELYRNLKEIVWNNEV